MFAKTVQLVVAFTLSLSILGGGRLWAQEKAKTNDDALESLLKELNGPEQGASPSDKPAKAKAAKPKAGSSQAKGKKSPEPELDRCQNRQRSSGQALRAQVIRGGQGLTQRPSTRRITRKTGRDQGRAGRR